MKSTSMLAITAVLALGLSKLPTAHADTLNLTFAQPAQSASAPGILAYTGTIVAPSTNGSAVFLNGDAITLAGPYHFDDSAFLNTPLSLAPGNSYTGVLFDIEFSDLLLTGTFNGTFILLGGRDGGAQDVLATERFSVAANPSPTAVTPEPSSLLLLFSGTVLLTAGRHIRRPSTC